MGAATRRRRLGDDASRGRSPLGDGGATAAEGSGTVAGYAGGAAAMGGAAPTRPPDTVGRVLVIDWH